MPLSTFLSDPWPAHHVVAADRHRRLNMGELRAQVAANTRRIAERCARRAMLVCDHGDAFVVGLYALLYAGVEVVLPPNASAGTLRALAGSFDLLVSDTEADDTGALRLVAGRAETTSLAALV